MPPTRDAASPPTTLSLIGGGRLATNLGRLWSASGRIVIQDVLCRSPERARHAVALIGAGRPITDYRELRGSEAVLVATTDRAIRPVARELAMSGGVAGARVAFHCSGTESSDALADLRPVGLAVCSAHPLMTFTAEPLSAAEFAGAFCAVEGDVAAGEEVREWFAAIGARCIAVEKRQKLLHHAAAVFASNYVTTLMQVAVDLQAALGIPADVSVQMLAPLVGRSLANAARVGPRAALTGPVARQDLEIVQRQWAALAAAQPEAAELYRVLATQTARVLSVQDPFGTDVLAAPASDTGPESSGSGGGL